MALADRVRTSAGATCAVDVLGDMRCWGTNLGGILGYSPSSMISLPFPMYSPPWLANVTQAAVSGFDISSNGLFFACALRNSGDVYCAGSPMDPAVFQPAPINMSDVRSLDAGRAHLCAVFLDGTVACVGCGCDGRLGYGDTAPQLFAAPYARVSTSSPCVSIAAGGGHTCALLVTGQVQCWGSNLNGQLGTGTFNDLLSPSTVVEGLTGVLAIDAGDAFTCALLNNTEVRCWGDNSNSQLGVHSQTTEFSTPRAVLSAPSVHLTNVAQLACGNFHACALLFNGTLRCWGLNSFAQLGLPSSISELSMASMDVPISMPAVAVASGPGSQYTCVVLVSGRVQCFGGNEDGQLGIGFPTDAEQPGQTALNLNVLRRVTVVTTPLQSVAAVVPNGYAMCLLVSGRVTCVGSNTDSELGIGKERPLERAMITNFVEDATSLQLVTKLYAGCQGSSYCAAHSSTDLSVSSVSCWGSMQDMSLTPTPMAPTVVPRLQGAKHMSLNWRLACAVLSNGDLICWGYNDEGQLGIGGTVPHFVGAIEDAQVVSSSLLSAPAIQVAAATEATCVLLDTTTRDVKCWGSNAVGQHGLGTAPMSLAAPSASITISGVADLQPGGQHFCSLGVDGRVRCWGSNDVGQVGLISNVASSPVAAVPGMENITQIACGVEHSCALKASGHLYCWGSNARGALGVAEDVEHTQSTGPLHIRSGVAKVSAAGWSTCVVLVDGTAVCWGANDYGQLGQGDTLNRFRSDLPPISVFTVDN
jgi:alpha-tubulin suppressor-like RCC1 family protein